MSVELWNSYIVQQAEIDRYRDSRHVLFWDADVDSVSVWSETSTCVKFANAFTIHIAGKIAVAKAKKTKAASESTAGLFTLPFFNTWLSTSLYFFV